MVDGRWSMVDGRWWMVDGRWSMVDGRWSATIRLMRFTGVVGFALVFSLPGHSRAQFKREIRVQAGGELGKGSGDDGGVALGPYVGIAYAPNHFWSFGVIGAYGLPGSGGCYVSYSGAGGACSSFHPYRLT